MKRTLIAALVLSSAFCAARTNASPPAGDKVFPAMKDELSRSMEKLDMDKLGKPYLLSYHVGDGHSFSVTSAFGAVESLYSSDYRRR